MTQQSDPNLSILTTYELSTPIQGQNHSAAMLVLQPIITSWVKAQYRSLPNRLMAERAVCAFFIWLAENHDISPKEPQRVSAGHVGGWIEIMEGAKLSPATIYTRLSRLSAFYKWMMKDSRMGQVVTQNPVTSVRPPAPKPYSNSQSKALDDRQLRSIINYMQIEASHPKAIAAKRDYAIFLWLIYTGLRREEVISLRWDDITWHDAETISFRTTLKGGEKLTQQLAEPTTINALSDYLEASNRRQGMKSNSPLWVSSAKGKTCINPQALTARAFDYAMKKVAHICGIEHFHIHMTRHTFARLVHEMTDGDLYQVQRELNHKNVATTRVYVQAVGIKKDRFSGRIAARISRKEQ